MQMASARRVPNTILQGLWGHGVWASLGLRCHRRVEYGRRRWKFESGNSIEVVETLASLTALAYSEFAAFAEAPVLAGFDTPPAWSVNV